MNRWWNISFKRQPNSKISKEVLEKCEAISLARCAKRRSATLISWKLLFIFFKHAFSQYHVATSSTSQTFSPLRNSFINEILLVHQMTRRAPSWRRSPTGSCKMSFTLIMSYLKEKKIVCIDGRGRHIEICGTLNSIIPLTPY